MSHAGDPVAHQHGAGAGAGGGLFVSSWTGCQGTGRATSLHRGRLKRERCCKASGGGVMEEETDQTG